jgi:spore maturation protein CgeB
MIIELDIPGFSPRIFEAAAAGCLLLLDDDCDSLDLIAGEDFVEVTTDLESSLLKFKDLLNDPEQMLQMCTRAYEKLIKSGRYSVNTFVKETVGIISYSKNQEPR